MLFLEITNLALCNLSGFCCVIFQPNFIRLVVFLDIEIRLSNYEIKWMRIYISHISDIVSRRFTILIEWDWTSACKGASGCRCQLLFDLTHPPNPCIKCTMLLQTDHHTGNYVPYSFRQVCGFFNVPCSPCNSEDTRDGAYGLQSLSEKTWMSDYLPI